MLGYSRFEPLPLTEKGFLYEIYILHKRKHLADKGQKFLQTQAKSVDRQKNLPVHRQWL